MVCTNCLKKKKKKKTFWGVLWFIYPRSHTLVLLCCLAPPYFCRHLLLLALLYCVTPPKCLPFFFLDKRGRGPRVACRLMLVPPVHFFFFFFFSVFNVQRLTRHVQSPLLAFCGSLIHFGIFDTCCYNHVLYVWDFHVLELPSYWNF